MRLGQGMCVSHLHKWPEQLGGNFTTVRNTAEIVSAILRSQNYIQQNDGDHVNAFKKLPKKKKKKKEIHVCLVYFSTVVK